MRKTSSRKRKVEEALAEDRGNLEDDHPLEKKLKTEEKQDEGNIASNENQDYTLWLPPEILREVLKLLEIGGLLNASQVSNWWAKESKTISISQTPFFCKNKSFLVEISGQLTLEKKALSYRTNIFNESNCDAQKAEEILEACRSILHNPEKTGTEGKLNSVEKLLNPLSENFLIQYLLALLAIHSTGSEIPKKEEYNKTKKLAEESAKKGCIDAWFLLAEIHYKKNKEEAYQAFKSGYELLRNEKLPGRFCQFENRIRELYKVGSYKTFFHRVFHHNIIHLLKHFSIETLVKNTSLLSKFKEASFIDKQAANKLLTRFSMGDLKKLNSFRMHSLLQSDFVINRFSKENILKMSNIKISLLKKYKQKDQ